MVAEVAAVSEIRVRRLTIAVDAGLVINPDGAANQVEGGAIQATSWALKEQVRFDRYGVTSDSWETYPILRFSEVPAVDVELLPGNGNPALGIGEAAQGPDGGRHRQRRVRRARGTGPHPAAHRGAHPRRHAGLIQTQKSEESRRPGGDRLGERLDLGHPGSHVVVEPACQLERGDVVRAYG